MWKQIGDQFMVNKDTVRSIIKKFKLTGSVEDREVSGRPRLTSPTDDRKIVLLAKQKSKEYTRT